MGTLSGVRVLDLSRVLAGPYCTSLLADLGADVIKVEQPGKGDDARSLGPFRGDESVYFAMLNRGKRSITLNLRDADGVAVLRELVRGADVVVENYRPGVAQRLGVTYEDLKEHNEGLVYLSISGFGQTGPLATAPAYDLIVQAMSGLMEATGFPDGPPTRIGESFGDLVAGLFGAWSVSAALFDRERTGKGTHLDVSMFECLVSMQVTAQSLLQVNGRTPGRVGNRHPVSTPFDAYQAADGLVVIAVANEAIFARLAAMMDLPGLVDDPRFASDPLRTDNEPEMRAVIESWASTRTVQDIIAEAGLSGVPAAPLWDLEAALGSAHSQERGLVANIDDPRVGSFDSVPQPVRFSGHRQMVDGHSPALGQDTNDVLGESLGLDSDRIEALRQQGVL
jgi:CoA:oxalate CoA-transferase